LHTGDVLADFLDRRIEFGLTPSVDEDVRALLDEPLGGSLALQKRHDHAFR
jgi:hypothetical protein